MTTKTTLTKVMESLSIACVIVLTVWVSVLATLGFLGVEVNLFKAFVFEALTIVNTALAVYVFKYR